VRGRVATICVVATMAVACSVAAAAVPGVGTYKGVTSQQDPKSKKFQRVEVQVGSKGKRIKRIRAGFQTKCTDGSGYFSGFFYLPDEVDRVVRKGGRFSFESSYKPPDLNPGETADVFVRGSGRFTTAKKLKGTMTVQANIFTGGATTGALKCTSGKITFSAKR